MPHLLVIGGASLDILHFAGQTVASAGGAGMYTAMAAQRSGIQVSLFAPRPSPMPEILQPIAARVTEWHGPVVPPEELPHFEIAHHDDTAIYLKALFGAEGRLLPQDLPSNLSHYDCIHIVPLGSAQMQLDFLQACRQRGAKRLSAGTVLYRIIHEAELVQAALEAADLFFMNEQEATALFGSLEKARVTPGKILFITLGKSGARIVQGEYTSLVPGTPAQVLDPTGAGDSFCGATLAHLILGEHPVMAAGAATPLAAEMIEQVGPAALLQSFPPPKIPTDGRVVVNETQLKRISNLIAQLPEVAPFDFCGEEFPPIGHPATLDFFFASTLQQFGFWTESEGSYYQPLIAPLDGKLRKGSFYLFQAYLRCLDSQAEFYTPARQASLRREDMLALLRADDGSDPMPALDLHLTQAQQYGKDMLALKLTPHTLVEQARASTVPLKSFLSLLDHIGGYKEDPLRKKATLLALILNQRPEAFLPFGADEKAPPVIDYHLMRSCLRTGLIQVQDADLEKRLVSRRLLSAEDEWAVRYAAYQAIDRLVVESGQPMGAVDWFFFNARQRCPEMTEPLCHLCPVDPVCLHFKELFQPVFRTTFY